MSDGATVSAIGPITVPMATISANPPWMVGLATAFASSFAHMLIIGTPNNAIAYAMAKDPVTGEQLVDLGDFFKHGLGGPAAVLRGAVGLDLLRLLAVDRASAGRREGGDGWTDKIKLLIVDDEVKFLDSIARASSMRDFDVTKASNGEEAAAARTEKLRPRPCST